MKRIFLMGLVSVMGSVKPVVNVCNISDLEEKTILEEEKKELNAFKTKVLAWKPVPYPEYGLSLCQRGETPFLTIVEDELYTDTVFTKKELEERAKKEALRASLAAKEKVKVQAVFGQKNVFLQRNNTRTRKNPPSLLGSLPE